MNTMIETRECIPGSTATMTYDGVLFDALNPTLETVPTIEAIAHQLACVNRFSGALESPYSVAEHSVRVSWLLSGPNALAGLLHDASEAFLGDIPRPFKYSPMFAPYREAEARLQAVLMRAYGPYQWEEGAVKWADEQMVHVEAFRLSMVRPAWIDMEKVRIGSAAFPAGDEALPWQDAKIAFLSRFDALTHWHNVREGEARG